MKVEDINAEILDTIFDDLKDLHDYWGEKKILQMLDFCNRNKLKHQKSILLTLMKTDRLK